MLKRGMNTILATWISGLLALLPLILTVTLLAWVVSVLHNHLGPDSHAGQFMTVVGQPFVDHPSLEYVAGALLLVIVIYPLGMAVQSSLHRPLKAILEGTLRRIPVIGSLYNLAGRFVGLLDQRKDADIASMSPVWCIFGGDGVAVLALRPIPDLIEIDGREYLAVLVPTAPIPVGGGLLYVPKEWVRPANIGVDKLTSIYFSMGIIPPPSLLKAVQTDSAAGSIQREGAPKN
jgi:uncharacterized membrane protein